MPDYTEHFELERPALMAIAYQMLGERAAAQSLQVNQFRLFGSLVTKLSEKLNH